MVFRKGAFPQRWVILAVCFLLLAVGSYVARAADRPFLDRLRKAFGQRRNPGLVEHTIEIDNKTRRFLVFTPQNASGPLPLVLALHGGGGNMWGIANFLGFHTLAASEGFIVAYPEAMSGNWNDGRTVNLQGLEYLKEIDDVKFLTTVIDVIGNSTPVDSKRVFSTGISNGGFMSQYLAIKAADRIAAIAAVTAGIGKDAAASFSPSLPLSVMVINGTEDPLVPYVGGEVKLFRKTRGLTIGTDETVAKWVGFDGCHPEPAVASMPDTDPKDGCRAETFTWSGGKSATEVVLVKVVGGGHTWPGGAQYLPRAIIGRVCRDFHATRLIWNFFRSHPRQ